jgi:hypothetical protein
MKVLLVRINMYGLPILLFSSISSSLLGCLSSSIHGTKQLGTELAINLELFSKAYYASTHHCSSSELLPLIEYLKTGRTYSRKQHLSTESISEHDLNLLHQLIPKESKIQCMKSGMCNLSSLYPRDV